MENSANHFKLINAICQKLTAKLIPNNERSGTSSLIQEQNFTHHGVRDPSGCNRTSKNTTNRIYWIGMKQMYYSYIIIYTENTRGLKKSIYTKHEANAQTELNFFPLFQQQCSRKGAGPSIYWGAQEYEEIYLGVTMTSGGCMSVPLAHRVRNCSRYQ
jgi:hypothetical protein